MMSIRAEAAPGKPPTLHINDEIGPNDSGGGMTIEFVKNFLRQNARAPAIRVEICSDGGDVETGFSIYEALIQHSGTVVTHAYGRVASAASVIFLAGEKREMDASAEIMVHFSFMLFPSETAVQERELVSMSRHIYECNRRMERIISGRTGQSRDVVAKWLEEETFFDASQAKRYGFVTDIIGGVSYSSSARASVGSSSRKTEPPSPAVAMLEKYTTTFGPKAATKYLRAGLNWVQSLERYQDSLKAKLSKLRSQHADQLNEVAELKAQMRLLEEFNGPSPKA